MRGVFLKLVFTCLGLERLDMCSPRDGVHDYTD